MAAWQEVVCNSLFCPGADPMFQKEKSSRSHRHPPPAKPKPKIHEPRGSTNQKDARFEPQKKIKRASTPSPLRQATQDGTTSLKTSLKPQKLKTQTNLGAPQPIKPQASRGLSRSNHKPQADHGPRQSNLVRADRVKASHVSSPPRFEPVTFELCQKITKDVRNQSAGQLQSEGRSCNGRSNR